MGWFPPESLLKILLVNCKIVLMTLGILAVWEGWFSDVLYIYAVSSLRGFGTALLAQVILSTGSCDVEHHSR